MTPYEILGVPSDASQDDIKKAYRKAASHTHPDAGGEPGKFEEVAEAFRIVGCPERRATYDRFGAVANPEEVARKTVIETLSEMVESGLQDPVQTIKEEVQRKLAAAERSIKASRRKSEMIRNRIPKIKASKEILESLVANLRLRIGAIEAEIKEKEFNEAVLKEILKELDSIMIEELREEDRKPSPKELYRMVSRW